MKQNHYDVIIVGSGIAGLSLAINLSVSGKKILVLSKKGISESSTQYAQGGIASVYANRDSFQSHFEDTLKAGCGLCNTETVKKIIEAGPSIIDKLAQNGVNFSKNSSFIRDSQNGIKNPLNYHLTKEGGHEYHRIVHDADHTGASIQTSLLAVARTRSNIKLLPFHLAVSLVQRKDSSRQYEGIYVLDIKNNIVITISSIAIVLAAGGASKAYYYCTNPDVITGDGIALGWKAGCDVANMEFIQFHPTCLYHPQDRSFLISEAVRGEGAVLRNPDGQTFMGNYDTRADLAPRDVVSRAIDSEMKKKSYDNVYLDLSNISANKILSSFPTIFQKCLELGIDIRKQQIPVVPAAHYTCGGIKANIYGETNIKGIFAIGENACTGLHGANRLASNSLLEGAFMAEMATDVICDFVNNNNIKQVNIVPWDTSKVIDAKEQIIILHNWDELRRTMWNLVGIVRSDIHLNRAFKRIQNIKYEVNEYYSKYNVSRDLIELKNLATVAYLIISCALMRRESRGLHYNIDTPNMLEKAKNTIIKGYPYLDNQS